MKKHTRKLQLQAETIRTLSSSSLQNIVAGQLPPWGTASNRCTDAKDIFCPTRPAVCNI